MDAVDRRRRTGKGLGTPLLEIEDAGDASRALVDSTQSSCGPGHEEMQELREERNRAVSDISGKREVKTEAGAPTSAEGGVAIATSPFWSDEAKRRVQEHFLGTARATSVAAPPEGSPVSLGPDHWAASSGMESSGVQTSQAASGVSHGLSERERTILTQMKNAMVRIAAQNEELACVNTQLRQRVEKLEEEKSSAWWTASGSTPEGAEALGLDDQKGTRGISSPGDTAGIGNPELKGAGDTIPYQQGYEKGYLAAKEMFDAQGAAALGASYPAPLSTPCHHVSAICS